ncbi:TPA: hypothetical protein ACH3X2_000670 [Trebouxia sp. C0005]
MGEGEGKDEGKAVYEYEEQFKATGSHQPCVLEYKSPGYEGSGGEVGRGTTDTRAAMQLSMM